MNLYSTVTREKINVGDVVATFRGENVTVTGWPKNGHNRVWVKDANGNTCEYFPSVINAVLRED